MKSWKSWSTEKLSTRVFYVLVALCVVIFAMFWFVGYDRPYDDNPNYTAPLFTGAVLVLSYLLVLGGMGCAVWSVLRALKIRGKGEAYDNNIPVKRIGYTIFFGVLGLLIVTFALGSSSQMLINGVQFTDKFWLKFSDMLISTSLILAVVAVGAVVYGSSKSIRRK